MCTDPFFHIPNRQVSFEENREGHTSPQTTTTFRPQQAAVPLSYKGFQYHHSSMTSGPANKCPLLWCQLAVVMSYFPKSVFSCSGWGNNISCVNETTLYQSAHRPFLSPLLVAGYEKQGYSQLKESHCRNADITSVNGAGVDMVGRCIVLYLFFKILNSKFNMIGKQIIANILWIRLVFVVIIYESGTVTVLEWVMRSQYSHDYEVIIIK